VAFALLQRHALNADMLRA